MPRFKRVIGIIFVCAVAWPGQSAAAADSIKFGLISSFSGPAAGWGVPHATSVEIAVDHINELGGISLNDKAYRLELIKYDHAYDITKAVTAVRQAVQKDNVKFVEILGGGVASAVQAITEKEKTILFVAGAGTQFLGPEHYFTFRNYWDTGASLEKILLVARAVADLKGKVVTVYPDDELGESAAALAEKVAGRLGFSYDDIYVPRDMADFYPVVLRVLREQPAAIDFGPGIGTQYAILAKLLRQHKYQGLFLFSDTMDVPAIRAAGAWELVQGSLSAPYLEPSNTPAGRYWMEQFSNRYGPPVLQVAFSYDSLFLLKAAIEQSQSLDTARVARALDEVSVTGVFGQSKFGMADKYEIPRALETDLSVGRVEKNEIQRVPEVLY